MIPPNSFFTFLFKESSFNSPSSSVHLLFKYSLNISLTLSNPAIMASCTIPNTFLSNSSLLISLSSSDTLSLKHLYTMSPYNSFAIRSSILYGSGLPYQDAAFE